MVPMNGEVVPRVGADPFGAVPSVRDRRRAGARRALGRWFAAILTLGIGVAEQARSALPPALLELEGQVQVSRARSTAWDPGYTNQVLLAGDRVRTGPRSRAV